MSKELIGGFDSECNWPGLVAAQRTELHRLQRRLADEQRKVKCLLNVVKLVDNSMYALPGFAGEMFGDKVDDALLYCDVMTIDEREQDEEESASRAAAEDEAVLARQGA